MKSFGLETIRSLFCLAAAIATAIVVTRAEAQCPGGQCPISRQPSTFQAPNAERRPTPAWRYAEAVGHRAAVVRVFCMETERVRSIGSGVLVRWGGKIVVLTARHVIADAKRIIVELHTKRTHWGRVLRTDARWDCAVLELVGRPEGVQPAEVELGDAAMQREGVRLESCGYGPDGRLAVNSGMFIGYRRSSENPNSPPDDWFEISGPARQGDSGGPIFNERGRVVGILWGTTGKVVVGVQAGRLHLLLDAAVPPVRKQAYRLTAYEAGRHPTPPKPAIPIENLPDATDNSGCWNNGECPLPGPELSNPVAPASQEKTKPLLPWRENTQSRDDAQDARIDALIRLGERMARPQSEPNVDVAIQASPKAAPEKNETSPLVAGLCILAAVGAGFLLYFSLPKK